MAAGVSHETHNTPNYAAFKNCEGSDSGHILLCKKKKKKGCLRTTTKSKKKIPEQVLEPCCKWSKRCWRQTSKGVALNVRVTPPAAPAVTAKNTESCQTLTDTPEHEKT